MCTRPIIKTIPNSLGQRLLGISSPLTIQLPCGKCAECLGKKRNSVVARCYNEALKRGKVAFVTLTYNNENLPITESLWRCHRETGEFDLYGDCQYVPNEYDDIIRKRLLSQYDYVKSWKMRNILERHQFSDYDKDYEYYISYSFSHRYDDVKRLIKRCRLLYNQINKCQLDFSYIIVPEFGEKYSRRPHYHCLFFGAPSDFVWFFHNSWFKGLCRLSKPARYIYAESQYSISFHGTFNYMYTQDAESVFHRPVLDCRGRFVPAFYTLNPAFGFAYTEFVERVNDSDKSDGYAKIAAYLGKYVGKGIFEDSLVRDGFIELPRISVSHHFGELPQHLVDWHLAKDKFNYNPDNLYGLSKQTIKEIAETIAGRWFHEIPGYSKPIGLPTQFKNQIFNRRIAKTREELPAVLNYVQKNFSDWPDSGKAYFSQIYYVVADFIQHKFVQDNQKKFEQFIRNYHTKDICSAVSAFESYQQARLQFREKVANARYKKKLQSAKF